MHTVVAVPAAGLSLGIAVGGFACLGLAVYWAFNANAKKKQLATLRKQLEAAAPTDPEYNDIKTLYLSLMQDGIRTDADTAHDHGSDFSGHDSGGDFGGHH